MFWSTYDLVYYTWPSLQAFFFLKVWCARTKLRFFWIRAMHCAVQSKDHLFHAGCNIVTLKPYVSTSVFNHLYINTQDKSTIFSSLKCANETKWKPGHSYSFRTLLSLFEVNPRLSTNGVSLRQDHLFIEQWQMKNVFFDLKFTNHLIWHSWNFGHSSHTLFTVQFSLSTNLYLWLFPQ